MNDMDKLKKLQFVARFLREHDGYVRNKKSTYSCRFNFKFNKEEKEIKIFNAKTGDNLYIWPEFIELAHGLNLNHYITYDTFDLKEVILRIY